MKVRAAKISIVAAVFVATVVGFLSSTVLAVAIAHKASHIAFLLQTRIAAGSTAINCGRITLSDDPREGVACAQTALDAAKPFRLIVEREGFDSSIEQALAVNAAGDIYEIGYDSMPCSGCLPGYSVRKCEAGQASLEPSWRTREQV